MSDSTTPTTTLPTTIDMLRSEARERTFAVADQVKRDYVLHGYLLALEDVRTSTASCRRCGCGQP